MLTTSLLAYLLYLLLCTYLGRRVEVRAVGGVVARQVPVAQVTRRLDSIRHTRSTRHIHSTSHTSSTRRARSSSSSRGARSVSRPPYDLRSVPSQCTHRAHAMHIHAVRIQAVHMHAVHMHTAHVHISAHAVHCILP